MVFCKTHDIHNFEKLPEPLESREGFIYEVLELDFPGWFLSKLLAE